MATFGEVTITGSLTTFGNGEVWFVLVSITAGATTYTLLGSTEAVNQPVGQR